MFSYILSCYAFIGGGYLEGMTCLLWLVYKIHNDFRLGGECR